MVRRYPCKRKAKALRLVTGIYRRSSAAFPYRVSLAQPLPVDRVPEQPPVTTIRHNVVDDSCFRHRSQPLADHAQRVIIPEVLPPGLVPPRVVAALLDAAGIVLTVALALVALRRRSECRGKLRHEAPETTTPGAVSGSGRSSVTKQNMLVLMSKRQARRRLGNGRSSTSTVSIPRLRK